MQENICRIPVTATFSIINGKAVMTAAEYADIPAADIARYKTSVTPAVILIPGKSGSLGLGTQALQSAVERAVGADIG